MTRLERFAFVTPRYGPEVVGGAELGARLLAEHLVSDCGIEVDIYTSCALEASTWADHFPEGTDEINGVSVHRFRSTSGRYEDFDAWGTELMRHPQAASEAQASEWVKRQGPFCPAAVEAALASSAQLIGYYPYLYYPTVEGIARDPKRAILHAAAHDEQPIRLPVFRNVFETVAGLWMHSDDERDLITSMFNTSHIPQAVMGLGVSPGSGDAQLARAAVGLKDEPFLLCLGRVDAGKGTSSLAELFAAYKARNPGPLKLVIAGPVLDQPRQHPDILVPGKISEQDKWGLLADTQVLVSPSAHESFSLVLMEAWTESKPVLVNARGAVTTGHARASGGGLWYDGYAHFEAALSRLLVDAEVRDQLGRNGYEYVASRFAWPALMKRYVAFLESCLA